MQEENKIAPAASSHTEIQIRPTSLSASSSNELGLKNWAIVVKRLNLQEQKFAVLLSGDCICNVK
jgi:hypothetical protein